MEDRECVLIYNGAMSAVVHCARRDCAMPELAGHGAKDDLALCRYFSVPLWTPTRSAAKRVRSELEDSKTATWKQRTPGKGAIFTPCPPRSDPRRARFALPALRCFRYTP